MIARARRRGIPIVFALHNFAYTNPRFFANVDYCLVASEFARRHYRDKVGLDCQALSYPLDWDRVYVERPDGALSRSSTHASRKEFTRSAASPTSWAGAGRMYRSWWSRAGGPRKRSVLAAWTWKPPATFRS